MAEAIKSNFSFEDLEQYRDEEGFIDLDKLNIELTEESREKVGNVNRIKNWIEFSGVKTLIKGECDIDGKRNAGIYAELIVEELAKQVGLPSAYYDLVKIQGQYGVLSKSILKSEYDDLHTLQSFIGDTNYNEDYPELSDYIEVEEKLYEALKDEELEKSNIKKIIKDFRKQTAFFLMICSVDKYAENISLISYINPETKEKKERLAPIYDSECSFMLDMDLETLEKIQKNGLGLQRNVNMLDPKIAVLEGDYSSPWRNTLDILCDDDEIYDFITESMDNIDIKSAIKSVEEKIKAPVPELIKSTVKYVYKFRKNEIEKILYPEIGEDEFAKQYSNEIMEKSISEDVRQGEEEEILRKIMNIYKIEERDSER